MSYSSREILYDSSTISQFNTQALKLGLMGVTIVVASGDDGVANAWTNGLYSNCGYDPAFPASSPYVTTVGATMGPEIGSTEVVCDANLGGVITSGGGFSVLSSMPGYQNRAVNGYFSKASPQPVAGYNSGGRGYPDVSLAGKYYETVIGGQGYYSSGTSASTPAFAAMVSLVNAARLKAGRPTLGFLNTAIYAYNGSFANDVTSGNNKCTHGASMICCAQGFNAAQGWDPTTGFGSVDFAKFYGLMMAIDVPSAAPTSFPSFVPTAVPSRPTSTPTVAPTTPTSTPTVAPSTPTVTPTRVPTLAPHSVATRALLNMVLMIVSIIVCISFGNV